MMLIIKQEKLNDSYGFNMAGWTGLEPAASGVTGRQKPFQIIKVLRKPLQTFKILNRSSSINCSI